MNELSQSGVEVIDPTLCVSKNPPELNKHSGFPFLPKVRLLQPLLVGRRWETSSKIHIYLTYIIQSPDFSVSFVFCSVLFWIYFSWASLSCSGEVARDGFWHLRKMLSSFPIPSLHNPFSPFLSVCASALPSKSRATHASWGLPGLLEALFTSHLQQALTSIHFVIVHYNPVESRAKYHFCHFTDEKTENKGV